MISDGKNVTLFENHEQFYSGKVQMVGADMLTAKVKSYGLSVTTK